MAGEGAAVSGAAIDTYRRATESMRESTKWLVALVPVVGFAALVGQVAPALIQADHHRGLFVAAVVALFAGLGAAAYGIGLAAQVLIASVPGWGDAVRAAASTTSPAGPAAGTLRADLDSEGVLALYGYDTVGTLFAEVLGSKPATENTTAAGVLVVDFAAFLEVRRRFREFLMKGAGALLLATILISLAVILANQSSAETTEAAKVERPIPVVLQPTRVAARRLRDEHGCRRTTSLHAWAIGGTLAAPHLVLIDPSCKPAAIEWHDEDGLVVPVATP